MRLRVTDLDMYRRYLQAPEYAEITLEELLAHLRRELPETEPMRVGKAFHAVLETAAAGDEISDAPSGGYVFHFDEDTALAVPDRREVFVERQIGAVLLRGRLDGWDSGLVVDYKLTFGAFDAERYAESLQWRAYLAMTGMRRFDYVVFQAKQKGPHVWIYDRHDLTFWSYPEMRGEVERWVHDLADFIRIHVPDFQQIQEDRYANR